MKKMIAIILEWHYLKDNRKKVNHPSNKDFRDNLIWKTNSNNIEEVIRRIKVETFTMNKILIAQMEMKVFINLWEQE